MVFDFKKQYKELYQPHEKPEIITVTRLRHEIYLFDPRKIPTEKWRTVIRHPVAAV